MHEGVIYGLASALLFGVSTPLAKWLVGTVPPPMLAGLLYAGSGAGLSVVLVARALLAPERTIVALPRRTEWAWLAGAIVLGGVLGPVALMYGLTVTPASTASLLLNLEAVFTALLAWFLFRENFDGRIATGMFAIVAGGALLAWSPIHVGGSSKGPVLIALACAAWALDNNFTRRISTSDATMIAAVKGLVAASVNLALAMAMGFELPAAPLALVSAAVGFLGYGVSLVLFVLALRHLGAARAGAYFSVAPFFGAAVALLLQHDAFGWQLGVAAALMALGVWLHVTERHGHEHAHEFLEHAHAHVHDAHHQHTHDAWDGREPHTHWHAHAPMVHEHPHYPDVHHRHPH